MTVEKSVPSNPKCRRITLDEWNKEGLERFGDDMKQYTEKANHA